MEAAGEPARVQTLGRVPPQYIQPPNLRPSNHTTTPPETQTIPSIDIDVTRGTNIVRQEIATACRDWGAFHVINHGVPIQLLDGMRKAGSSFFEDLPMSEKLKYGCDPNFPASEGYGSRMLVASNDTVLDWRDYFDHHTFPLSRRNPNRWPESPSNYRFILLSWLVCPLFIFYLFLVGEYEKVELWALSLTSAPTSPIIRENYPHWKLSNAFELRINDISL